MLRIFGLVIMTKKEEETIKRDLDQVWTRLVQRDAGMLHLIGENLELQCRTDEAANKLRDDIMRLDIDEHEWYIVNTIMDLIDKNFGEEDIPEEDVKIPEIKFGGF